MIVSDSTCLIHLSRIGKLDILEKTFAQVIIPEAVYEETVVIGKEKSIADSENIRTRKWIIKKDLSEKEKPASKNLLANANIGKGESEAIILAKSLKLNLIIDD